MKIDENKNFKFLRLLRNISLVSFVVKTNIALGLAWYGEFYSSKQVLNSATPFVWASFASVCSCGILCAIISDEGKF